MRRRVWDFWRRGRVGSVVGWWWWGSGARWRGVVVVVVVVFGGGGGGVEVEVKAGLLLGVKVGGEEEVGVDVASLVGEEGASGFDLRGVLKGDLKGWDRVFVAVFRRRRLEGLMGDMIEGVW